MFLINLTLIHPHYVIDVGRLIEAATDPSLIVRMVGEVAMQKMNKTWIKLAKEILTSQEGKYCKLAAINIISLNNKITIADQRNAAYINWVQLLHQVTRQTLAEHINKRGK